MSKLSDGDTHYVLSRLPKHILEMLKTDPNIFLAGGFIRAVIAQEMPHDIDIFGSRQDYVKGASKRLWDWRSGHGETVRMIATENATTVITHGRLPVQFVHRWVFHNIHECYMSFDFTVCQAAIGFDCDAGVFASVCSEDFYPDLAARRLRYTAPERNEDAGGSLLRVIKYVRRGYNIQVDSLGAICARLYAGIKPEKRDEDEHYHGIILTGLLREVDPLTPIDGLELSDADLSRE